LNLLQFTASGAAEPSASSMEVVRGTFFNANLGSEFLHDMPDELFRYSFASSSTGATHTPEKFPRMNSGDLSPVVQHAMHPIWNGNRSNVTCLSAQLYDCPMPFALL
jgi:hypothetical protein